MSLNFRKIPIIQGLPQKVIFKIGPPCSGKGVEGLALKHLHGKRRYLGRLTMRDVLKEKMSRDAEFRNLVQQCERDGVLVPNTHICKILAEMHRHHRIPHKVLFFDGMPRDPEQVEIIAHMFQRTTVFVSENYASPAHLREVFLSTVDSPDRAGRLDAKLVTHNERVELYESHLPAIKRSIEKYGWKYGTCDATLPLSERVVHLQKFIGLPTVGRTRMQRLESDLGLPRLIPQAV